METTILIVVSLHLVAEVVQIVLSLPRYKRVSHQESAHMAVTSTEQFQGAASSEDKARIATAHLLDLHPKMKPAMARMLVEGAVSAMNGRRAPK